MSAILTACKKDEAALPPAPILIGQTYSGYSSTISGERLFRGYEFISSTKAWELLLENNTRVMHRVEVVYTYTYPTMKIEGGSFSVGGADAQFSADGSFTVFGVKMTKN